MTLDEAIDYCEKIAEKNEMLCKTNDEYNFSQPKWKKTAEEYRQIVEYLQELKRYRVIDSVSVC